jgi:hypothetical protein
MAAAESPVVSTYIPLLVATLPVILSPLVAWALGRSRISKDAATLDYLNKRLDFLERLNKLHTQLTEGPVKSLLDIEIEYCRTFLNQSPTFIPREAEVAAGAPQSRWARFFLIQPARSVGKRIFKGLFYFFFGIAAFALLGIPFALFGDVEAAIGFLAISGFYLGLALLFRRLAR